MTNEQKMRAMQWSKTMYGFVVNDVSGTPVHPLVAIITGAWPLAGTTPREAAFELVREQGERWFRRKTEKLARGR